MVQGVHKNHSLVAKFRVKSSVIQTSFFTLNKKKKKILLSQSHFCTWNSHPFKEWHRTMQRSGHRAVAYRDEGSEATAQQHTALKIIQINKSVTRELLFQWQSRTKQVLVLWLPDYPQCLTHSSLPGSVFSPAWLLPTPTCPCIY